MTVQDIYHQLDQAGYPQAVTGDVEEGAEDRQPVYSPGVLVAQEGDGFTVRVVGYNEYHPDAGNLLHARASEVREQLELAGYLVTDTSATTFYVAESSAVTEAEPEPEVGPKLGVVPESPVPTLDELLVVQIAPQDDGEPQA